MKDFNGKIAFITGGGSGIGRGTAIALAQRGASVAVCDIREEAADETTKMIHQAGGIANAFALDVSDANAVSRVADTIEDSLGPVSIVFNNAGIAMHGVPLHEISLDDWKWVMGVNVMGVIHGFRTFLPRMLARGGEGHIVNTASIGGFQVNDAFLTGAYSATKYTVVALTEGLQNELKGTGIGVSVLAPAAVNTGIHLSARSRPEWLGGAFERHQNHFMGDLIKDGLSGSDVGRRVVRAIEDGDFYIFTHPETQHWVEERHERIRDGYLKATMIQAESATEAAK
jgi:NAD(P)-dependent dehydrogenase (short-subunit alcohol dehydrogenase family)